MINPREKKHHHRFHLAQDPQFCILLQVLRDFGPRSLAASMAPKARVQAAQTATLELELPLLSDSDEHDGPPPPKRACTDASGPEADKEADKDDVFQFFVGQK